MTCTGTLLYGWTAGSLLSPREPRSFPPQLQSVPSVLSAMLVNSPAAIAVTHESCPLPSAPLNFQFTSGLIAPVRDYPEVIRRQIEKKGGL